MLIFQSFLSSWESADFASLHCLLTVPFKKWAKCINVNIHRVCLLFEYCKSQTRAPDAACGHPPPPPATWESNSNWLSGGEGLRLQPYSEQAGPGRLKQGAQVQIVFYKSPLQGICVYPRPLICCWCLLGKREKREWRGTPNEESKPKNMVFILLLDLQRAKLKERRDNYYYSVSFWFRIH